ncbi:MAG: hypothetical protein ACLPKB_30570 [Xanthobacteraceae bacterium]
MSMHSCTRFLRSLALTAHVLSVVSGCTIADSSLIDPGAAAGAPGVECSSRLGSYALPKSFVHVIVGQTDPKSTPQLAFADLNNVAFDIVRRPDPVLTFCLDYLASAFANDDISVTKYLPPDGNEFSGRQFLGSVLVNSTDQSAQIIRALIRTASVLISGNPNYRDVQLDSKPQILADLEYDPFDTRESAIVNERLTALGICLVLEGFTFDMRAYNVDQYCNSPPIGWRHPPRVAELYAAASQERVVPHTASILYRPRQAYRVAVYKKPDRGGGAVRNVVGIRDAISSNVKLSDY